MAPKEIEFKHDPALAQRKLVDMLDPQHPLVTLASQIDWPAAITQFGALYVDAVGRPGVPIRLMVGLHYLGRRARKVRSLARERRSAGTAQCAAKPLLHREERRVASHAR